MFKFRRMRAMDPLQVAMTGVRMGEKYLQILCSDATLTSGLATKVGLSGMAALAAPDDKQAARAQAAANKAGALIDVKVAPLERARVARRDLRHGRHRQHGRRFCRANDGRAGSGSCGRAPRAATGRPRRTHRTDRRRIHRRHARRPGGVHATTAAPKAASAPPASSRSGRWQRKTDFGSSRA